MVGWPRGRLNLAGLRRRLWSLALRFVPRCVHNAQIPAILMRANGDFVSSNIMGLFWKMTGSACLWILPGAMAQLVARFVRIEEVRSSNLLSSTTKAL